MLMNKPCAGQRPAVDRHASSPGRSLAGHCLCMGNIDGPPGRADILRSPDSDIRQRSARLVQTAERKASPLSSVPQEVRAGSTGWRHLTARLQRHRPAAFDSHAEPHEATLKQ